MANKRIIEQTASTTISNDDWLIKDSPTDGTTKIQASVFKTLMNDGMASDEDLADAIENIAGEYDSEVEYSKDALCFKDGVLYIANADTTGTWDSTKWDATTIADIIANLRIDANDVVDVKVKGDSLVNSSKIAVLDSLTAQGSASGSIASFSDGSTYPMSKLKVGIEPIQEGSGDPSPTNVRPISGHTEANISNVGDNWGDCADIAEPKTTNTWYTVNLPYNTYTISFDVVNAVRAGLGNTSLFSVNGSNNILADRIYSVTDGSTYQSKGANVSGRFYFTFTGKFSSLGCYWRSNSYQSLTSGSLENIMIEVGNNPTKQYTPYNGQTYNIQFKDGSNPLTVYGGTLDVVSGELTVDRVSADLGTLYWSYSTADVRFFTTRITDIKKVMDATIVMNGLCSHYDIVAYQYVHKSTALDGVMGLYSTSTTNYLAIKDTRYTDATSFKTALNGVQLVYELATPQTYQLTPTQVKSLLGTNNVWADTGDVNEAVYTRDLNTTVNDIISRIEALENA